MDRAFGPLGPLPFWKMSGSGNDFVVIDNRDQIIPESLIPEWTRRVCRPRVGIGADGTVLIESLPAAHPASANFRWRYFNADGSEGEMCGNGAMCGARFAIEQGIASNPCTFLTCSGLVSAELNVESGIVWLDMPDTGAVHSSLTFEVQGIPVVVHAVNVGVPHVVILVDDADAWPPAGSFESAGEAIRRNPLFEPAGTNVNVVSRLANGGLRMRTYERGVEAETLACGTGAVASAVVASTLGFAEPPVRVLTSSGRSLLTDFELNENAANGVRLGGAATVVATGLMMPGAWTDHAGDEPEHD